MKTYVLMLSQVFPADHPKAGIPTGFKHKLQAALNGWSDLTFAKLHTIRANYPLWAKRFEQIERGEACLSIRQWSGKPYASKQVEIARLTQEDGIGLQKFEVSANYAGINNWQFFKIDDRGYGKSGVDFLTAALPIDVITIITNPPYALADDFVKHAMDILPTGGRYFALMNLSYLAGQKRFKEIYNNGYLHAIHVYPHRIHCHKNNENIGHSSPVNYAWFEYKKISHDRNINRLFPPAIYWIEK